MYFTNRKIKEFPNHIISEGNNYAMGKNIIKSAIKLDVPTLKWNIVEPDGSTKFAQVKRIKDGL